MGAYDYGFRPYEEIEPDYGNVAASQTIAKGDFIILNTGGDLNIALAASAALYGVAMHAVTTTAANEQTQIAFWPAKLGAQFIGYCSGTGAETLRGDFVDLEGATGAMMVDENAGSTKVLQYIRSYTEEAAAGSRCPAVVAVVKSTYDGTEVS